ncbi:MAG: peptidoglycan DD-metalloendopeptidase family protein [Elusimicrobiales bacterium]|nr:peptidoglycan DD-metalloendopeptidase family protein [Elusimicrobiales bacterium]
MEKRLVFFCLILFFSILLCSQNRYDESQKKLEDIKKELEIKSREYDEYMKKYNEIVEMMKKLKKTEKDYYTRKIEYEKMIQSLKIKIEENRKQYDLLVQTQQHIKEDARLDIKKLYLSRFSSPFFYGKDEIIMDMVRRNIIIERKKVVDAIENKKKIFKQSIFDLKNKDILIQREKKQTENLLAQSKKEIERTQKELYITDTKLKKLKEDIERLNKTARELTNLIKDIEKKSPYRKNLNNELNIEKKSLPWPVIGTVISKFGREYLEDLKTWLVNDGIKIKTTSSTLVKPVMAGKVVYSGVFRGYGNIVLIEHQDGIFTTYGFLSEIYVKVGDEVKEFSEIGKVGLDERALDNNVSYVLYFEIRKGDIPVDPLLYLK